MIIFDPQIFVILGRRDPQMSSIENTEQFRAIQDSQAKINAYELLLKRNRQAQDKLKQIKKALTKRRNELDERGFQKEHKMIPDFLVKLSPVSDVRIIPPALAHQLLLKKSSSNDSNFARALNEDKQKKFKNVKIQRLNPLDLQQNPRKINFVLEAEKLDKKKTGLELYKESRKRHVKLEGTKKLSPLMEKKLKELKEKYGDCWQKIASFFNGYSFEDLYYHYQKYLSGVENGKWTLRQNIQLIVLIEYYGEGKWAAIAKKIKSKSEFQVRERYCNILDSSKGQNKWTPEEEKLLMEVAEDYKYKWSRLAREVKPFNSKTDNALRRKFRNTMIRRTDSQIDEQVKDQKLSESIKKFKKSYFNRKKKREIKEEEENGESGGEQY